MTCIHERKNFFVGLGHPRCGTGFTASLLSLNGLNVGHETVQKNGIVSWMLPGEKYRNPFYDAIGPLAAFPNIFCIARAPLSAIFSIIPENRVHPSYSFRRVIIQQKFGQDYLGGESVNAEIMHAVVSYTLWFELCLSFNPSLIYRIEQVADDELLSNFVGQQIVRNEKVERNSRPGRRDNSFSQNDLRHIPKEWLFRLAAVTRRLGYDEDAAIVEEYSHQLSIT